MTTKISGGLLPAPRRVDMAVNEDDFNSRAVTPAGRQDGDNQGWDPFEVWRTRVKEAREQAMPASPANPRKN